MSLFDLAEHKILFRYHFHILSSILRKDHKGDRFELQDYHRCQLNAQREYFANFIVWKKDEKHAIYFIISFKTWDYIMGS